jgi:hypothetical protein
MTALVASALSKINITKKNLSPPACIHHRQSPPYKLRKDNVPASL